MDSNAEDLLRNLDSLRRDNDSRLQTVERELARAIESLRESEERLRLAVEAAHIGIWEWDMLSNRVTWDAKKHDVFGLAQGSFAGTKEAFFDLVHPGDRLKMQAAISEAVERGAPYQNEFRIVGPSGATRWIANLGRVYRDDEGRPTRMLGVVYDVTDRKLTEASLRQSEEKFRSIVETTSEWIWALDRDGRITYSNPTVEAILGYRPEEVLGQSILALVHQGDQHHVNEIISRAIADKRGWSAFIVRCRHKDGIYRHLECHGVTVLDETDDVVGFRGSDRDVTDRVRSEQAVREAQKMEAIGRLAGSFAHHFNNLLMAIVGHVEAVSDQTGYEELQKDLQAIREATERGALLTRELLTFARGQFMAPRAVNVNDRIRQLIRRLPSLIGDNVELVTQLFPDLWTVMIDPDQLDLILVNLIVNAQEAMPHGGTLSVATANMAMDTTGAMSEAELMSGEYVVIAVTDTGTGISAQVLERIFEPFFSTKEIPSMHVGLGLSTCYGIVTEQGGHIDVQTLPGRGSTFKIYLRRLSGPEPRRANT